MVSAIGLEEALVAEDTVGVFKCGEEFTALRTEEPRIEWRCKTLVANAPCVEIAVDALGRSDMAGLRVMDA